ncbi:MAG: ABC transporter ATP-binding protein [Caldilineaceae bacterium]|nr:ABC transporter ATP-binding protein [Caldilineaceae bacterium]MDE0340353.1 ABC transporter ATP-binding protein [Caldilineaceae bacterium]
MANDSELLLEVSDLRMYFPIQKGLLRRTTGYVKAVDGVSLSIRKGETLGLVGESGCGKTTTGRCIVRVYQPTSGEIVFHEEGEIVDINRLTRQELKSFRRNMQMIFQDPFSSLNPRMTVLELVGEPLLAHGIARGQELEDRVAEMVRAVGLRVEHLPRYPHSFSGGQRQRIGIARALVQRPKLVVCDEPVSALDVSVQSQVVNLLQDLQSDLDLTYLFVAHDMSVVRQVSNRIAVMYVGKLVEVAESEELLRSPKHPYSETLLSAVPRPNPHHHMQRLNLEGEPADPANAPPGCVFHPRCRYMEDICQTEVPTLIELTPGHHVACHFADQLELQGIDYSRSPQV